MSVFEDLKFKSKSLATVVDSQDIEYLCFTKPSLAFKLPIIILNDGFYDYQVMQDLISSVKKKFPVYFVSLPNLNDSNQTITSSEQVNLLKGFCDNMGLEKINLLGISFSAVVAYNFASTFSECVEKLILQGITSSLRDSTRMILEENIKLLEDNNFEKFAASFSMNIMNFSRESMINKGREVHAKFYNKYKNINENQKRSTIFHLNRILKENTLSGRPSCETLVLAGQYDHFTTPYENFIVSKKCSNSKFGILKRVDHFASLEKNKMMSKIYVSYFLDEDISNFSGVDFYDDEFYPSTRRQIEPRYRWGESVIAKLGNLGKEINVNIIDLNGQGCKIQIKNDYTLNQLKNIEIEIFPNCLMNLLIFKKNENNTYHGIFNHRSLEETYDFLNVFADSIDNKKSFKAA